MNVRLVAKGHVLFEASVEATFSAAHQVHLPDGSLEPLHGHDWHVTATFTCERLDECGFVVDFIAAERCLAKIAEQLHHTNLNDAPLMAGKNPSAEIVAQVIFDQLALDETLSPTLDRVRITEAPGCTATYILQR
ncbi:MAG: 6-carboxy-5,6,7,8-tetrahydropterin synthase [Phycisphaerae bacterium]|nr:MAG: 6-carboxy-5,6,7,8-tetrahydropterin synthase [Phycisphaerae bacterium]